MEHKKNDTCVDGATPSPTFPSYFSTTPEPEYYSGWTSTDYWIAFYWLLLIGCSILIIFQVLGLCYNASRLRAEGRVSYVSGHGSSNRILITLFATYFFGLLGVAFAIARFNQWPSAASCGYAYVLAYIVYVSMKAANYFFFLQRFVKYKYY